MDLVKTQYVIVKLEDGSLAIQVPVVALLREMAKSTDNKLDDKAVDMIEAALKKD